MAQPQAIKSFRDDNIHRVVWWYGPVIKNRHQSEIPMIEVLTKTLQSNGSLSQESYAQEVPMSELDIIKIGSIWKGRTRIDRMWDRFEESQFTFDFSVCKPESVRFIEKNPVTGYPYISPTVYELGKMSQKTRYHFLNSTMTKLQSNSGVTVLVPSLEFLTGAIAPYHKQIRYKLLSQPLDTLTDGYLHAASIEGNKYIVKPDQKHFNENLMLLAYLQLNHTSRSRLSRLFASVQKTRYMKNGMPFEDRYPEVLPFHPTSMSLSGEGFLLDQNTYLMLRITGVSEPHDYEVEYVKTEYKVKPETNKAQQNPQSGPSNYGFVDPSELEVDHENGSSKRAGITYIRSRVKRLGPPAPITTSSIEKEIVQPSSPQTADKEEATGLSAEDPSNRNGTAGNAFMKQGGPESTDSTGILQKTIGALNHLVADSESQVAAFTYLGNDVKERNTLTYCHITKKQFTKDISGRWHMIKHSGVEGGKAWYTYRSFLIVKIFLTDGRTGYLLEIGRRSENEAFSGLLFNNFSNALSPENLKELLSAVVKNKGRYTEKYKQEEQTIQRALDLPIDISLIFRHRNIQVSLQSAIKKATEQGVFL